MNTEPKPEAVPLDEIGSLPPGPPLPSWTPNWRDLSDDDLRRLLGTYAQGPWLHIAGYTEFTVTAAVAGRHDPVVDYVLGLLLGPPSLVEDARMNQ